MRCIASLMLLWMLIGAPVPFKRLNRILGTLARRFDAAGINYDLPPGFEPLRRQIAKRSLDWGCSLTADDIVTTNGAMEALNLSISEE